MVKLVYPLKMLRISDKTVRNIKSVMGNKISLKKVIDFVELLNRYRRVKRVVMVNKENRWENDVEHSYQLAMLAWYLLDSLKIKFNTDLVLKYALIHDIVEVYAGDTYCYTKNHYRKISKHEREKTAIEKINKQFPEFKTLHKLIENYEKRKDFESKFVYALDKVQPILQIYTDKGRTWKIKKIDLKTLTDYKKDKISSSPLVQQLFNELVKVLEKEEKKLFVFKK